MGPELRWAGISIDRGGDSSAFSVNRTLVSYIMIIIVTIVLVLQVEIIEIARNYSVQYTTRMVAS